MHAPATDFARCWSDCKCFDERAVRLVTFCVPRADSRYEELWRFSTSTMNWTRIQTDPGIEADYLQGSDGTRPTARERHTMVIVGVDLWVFGGWRNVGEGTGDLPESDELFSLDVATFGHDVD